ncbi:MAG: hypothetical protein MZV49_05080 [Rhodopseudomonas palustris]|nr:hypothetical protein [Rhodopseudomonas palustris]
MEKTGMAGFNELKGLGKIHGFELQEVPALDHRRIAGEFHKDPHMP